MNQTPHIPTDAASEAGGVLYDRLAEGDEGALAEVYDRHGPALFTLAVAILGESADAEEVVADVFAALWRNPQAYDAERGSMGAYLTIMTRTKALDQLRAIRRRRGAEERSAAANPSGIASPLGESPPSTDRAMHRSEAKSRLAPALEVLSESQREVVYFAYLRGYTHSEIAAELSEPLGTVKTRLRSAMAKLRASLVTPKTGGQS